jgi:hypothetical protein
MKRSRSKELLINFKTIFILLVIVDIAFITFAENYDFTIFRLMGIIMLSFFNAVVLYIFDSSRNWNYDYQIWSFTPTYLLIISSLIFNVPDKESIISLLVLVVFTLSNFLRLRRISDKLKIHDYR